MAQQVRSFKVCERVVILIVFPKAVWHMFLELSFDIWSACVKYILAEEGEREDIQPSPSPLHSHLSETDTQRCFNPVFAHSNPSEGRIIAKYVRHKTQSQLRTHLRELWENSGLNCFNSGSLSSSITWRKASGHSHDTSPLSTVRARFIQHVNTDL